MSMQSAVAPEQASIVVQAPIDRALRAFRFVAESEQRTRVELEHRALERHGEGYEAMAAAVGSPNGWNGGLEAFARYVSA